MRLPVNTLTTLSCGVVLFLCGCHSGISDSAALVKPLSQLATLTSNGERDNERKLCVETARSVAQAGHYAEAIKLYQRAEELDPQANKFHAELADLYRVDGRTDAAIERYRLALDNSGDTLALYNNLVWCYLDAKRFEEGSRILAEALLEHPDAERLLAARACLCYHQGDHSKAYDHFKTLYGTAPALHNMALLDLAAGDEAKAHERVSLAVALDDCPTETIALHESLSQLR